MLIFTPKIIFIKKYLLITIFSELIIYLRYEVVSIKGLSFGFRSFSRAANAKLKSILVI